LLSSINLLLPMYFTFQYHIFLIGGKQLDLALKNVILCKSTVYEFIYVNSSFILLVLFPLLFRLFNPKHYYDFYIVFKFIRFLLILLWLLWPPILFPAISL